MQEKKDVGQSRPPQQKTQEKLTVFNHEEPESFSFFNKKQPQKIDPLAHHVKKQVRLTAVYIILAIIIIGGIFYFFLIRPAIQGYEVYAQLQAAGIPIDQLKDDYRVLRTGLESAQNNASFCHESLTHIYGWSNSINSTLSDLVVANAKKSSEYTELKSSLESQLATKAKSVEELTAQLLLKQTNLDELAKNSARQICCKARVDDSSINSFTTANNRITCGSGLEQQLTC